MLELQLIVRGDSNYKSCLYCENIFLNVGNANKINGYFCRDAAQNLLTVSSLHLTGGTGVDQHYSAP